MDMVHDRMERRASPPALTGETPTSLFFIRANPLKQTSQSTMANPPAKCSCHSLAGAYAGKLPRGAAKLNCCRKFQDVPHRQRRYPLPSKMKRGSSAHLTVRPLTPDLWPAFEDLFGKNGACNGCWCMYWRIGATYRKLPRDQNKSAFQEIVKRGPPPGLVAFDGDVAVGWCQLTPRDALPGLDRAWRLQRVDQVPVWSISCFYVRVGYRRQGVTSALISAALKVAKRAGAAAVEAYPLDADKTPSSSWTGYATTFKRAGFKVVARHVPARPIMRHALKTIAR